MYNRCFRAESGYTYMRRKVLSNRRTARAARGDYYNYDNNSNCTVNVNLNYSNNSNNVQEQQPVVQPREDNNQESVSIKPIIYPITYR